MKEGLLRITLVALGRGALQPHEVAGPVSVQSIRGCLRVTTGAGDVDIPAGSLVALDAGVAHSVRALDDCAALITVAIA